MAKTVTKTNKITFGKRKEGKHEKRTTKKGRKKEYRGQGR